MLRTLGFIFGFAFLLGGILGFIPGVVKDGMYFGIFMVNTPHNVLHIISGSVFLIVSSIGPRFTRIWFKVFGAFYAAMAIMGLVIGEGLIFGLISNNMYDAWGHAALAAVMLAIGFAVDSKNNADKQR